jgi:hypothetical protein
MFLNMSDCYKTNIEQTNYYPIPKMMTLDDFDIAVQNDGGHARSDEADEEEVEAED